MAERSRQTVILTALIIVATAAFGIGAAIEKSQHHKESPGSAGLPADVLTAARGASDSILVSGESGGEASESGDEAAGEHSTREQSESGGETHSEDLLGIDPESTVLVVLAIVGSLLLAAAVWLRPKAIPLLALVGPAMLFFCALDIREAVNQSDESNGGLMALALGIAALHLAAGGLAIWLAVAGQRKASHVTA
jgi:hypothetical protein